MSPKSNRERKVRAGLTVSSLGHAVILGWGLIAFAPAAFDTPPAESMPVDLVPITDLTELRAGNKDAPKKEEAKQTGEKKEEVKRAPEGEQPKPKLPEVKQAATPPEPKPEPKLEPEAKPEPRKEEPKPETMAEAAPMPLKRKPPPKPQPQP